MGGGRIVLALNCGSSSLKFGLYRAEENGVDLLFEGEAEEIGRPEGVFWTQHADGKRSEGKAAIPEHEVAGKLVAEALSAMPQPEAVGHRIVHGGPNLREHCLYREELKRDLEGAAEFAPLHVPPALQTLRTFRGEFPNAKHVLCFDSAFHANMPDVSATLPLPADIRKRGIRRYGFHGLALEAIVEELKPLPEKLIVAHLGNGCSVTAIRGGASVDTTMSLTPNAGMMMGTRCGDLDPGVPTWLIRHRGLNADELDDVLNRRSGLAGISETTSDVRELTERRRSDQRADLALRMFCHQTRKALASMAAALGGVDAIVFSGGIGEHAAELREQIVNGLEFLHCRDVRAVTAQEDAQIARIAERVSRLPEEFF